ncbi:amino acid ABC transporter permease [Desulfovibrio psychrotolerans]|uniref:Putative glutamine transport system permease protein GlnP n=1 Tax=Desulfovibrio psychrotolerans TaxID=415242 RepID=A0A7J0BW86_9BACT|nr:amino acid ABC transporter permease [Desulfovibrio psychrotolerans]GFM37425.1 amino acid ABC transporter permease [Desulfovibrio psychrotolerans]
MTVEKKEVRIAVTDGMLIPSSKDKTLVSAWTISLCLAIGTILYLCITQPKPYYEILKFLPDGIIVTFQVTISAIFVTIPIGLVTGLGRLSKNRAINLIASTYVEVIRGIPLLVQLFFIYYALGEFFQLPDLASAVIAMSVCYGAYMGEVFRAGIDAIDKGQTEAARSLGFNPRETMFLVVLPQAWRTILPPVGNEFIALLKDSSLVSILAVSELFRRGREYASVTFEYFEAYLMVALIYLLITLLLSKAVSIMEARLNYYDER